MNWNEAQCLAITSKDKNILCVSGPGSGKTAVGVERVRHRVTFDSAKVVVLTFTNGGGREFRDRLGIQIEFVGTIHSYGIRLIQRFGHLIGYKSGAVAILPEKEKLRLLSEIKERLGFKISNEKLWKRQTVVADQIWSEYEFILRKNNLVDYDRILTESARLLTFKEVAGAMTVDELVVDELQDSSKADFAIFGLIPATHRFYIGDPDQGIFAFRGAWPESLVELSQQPDWTVIKLEKNYRSDILICRAATRLIAHNTQRVPKDVQAVSGLPGKITTVSLVTHYEEVELVANNAIHCRQTSGVTVSILCRQIFQAEEITKYLWSRGVQVYEYQRGNLPGDWERALLLLSLAISPENEILSERYLRLKYSGPEVNRLKLEAIAANANLHHDIDISWHDKDGLWQLLTANGVGPATLATIERRAALLPVDAGLPELLQDLYSLEDLQPPLSEDLIYVGTIHSAKGREWDIVFLPGFEEGIIPHLPSGCVPPESEIEARMMEEERRLAFVGITRARHELHVSWARERRPQWGESRPMKPSRFLEEMST